MEDPVAFGDPLLGGSRKTQRAAGRAPGGRGENSLEPAIRGWVTSMRKHSLRWRKGSGATAKGEGQALGMCCLSQCKSEVRPEDTSVPFHARPARPLKVGERVGWRCPRGQGRVEAGEGNP